MWTGNPIRQGDLPRPLREKIRQVNAGQAEEFCANCALPLQPKKPWGEVCGEACAMAACGHCRLPKESVFEGFRCTEVDLSEARANLAHWPHMLEMEPFFEKARIISQETPVANQPWPPTPISLYAEAKGLCCRMYGIHGSCLQSGKLKPWCKTEPYCHRLLSAQLGRCANLSQKMRNGWTLRTLAILHDRLLKGERRRWVCKPCMARKREARESLVAASIAKEAAAEPEAAEPAEPAARKKRRTA
jgi:hypothetical protein